MGELSLNYLLDCKLKLVNYVFECDDFCLNELNNADIFIRHLISKVKKGKKVIPGEIQKLKKLHTRFNF